MITMRSLGLAIGIAFAASTFAFAQQGSPADNAAASGGSGTHQTAQKTGTAANTQKVIHNQSNRRMSSRHMRSGKLFAYQPARCRHMHHHKGSPMAKNCRY